jgi:hypothetical protein
VVESLVAQRLVMESPAVESLVVERSVVEPPAVESLVVERSVVESLVEQKCSGLARSLCGRTSPKRSGSRTRREGYMCNS